MRYELEPCFITSYSTSGDTDTFDFQSQATGVDEGHTGGANFAMGDGSVRSLNPYVTVDYTESLYASHYNPSSFQIISAGTSLNIGQRTCP